MLQPNEFKIYNASAGAGKTHTLVKEILSILLTNTSDFAFENILAITFTNKAANEMKQRILDWLVEFSDDKYLKKSTLIELAKELNISEEKIHQKSKRILTNIIHNYSKFSVSTIDKFNLRLMKSFAKDLNLSTSFEVEMESEKLIEESLHVLFSTLEDNKPLSNVLTDIALSNLNKNRSWDISRDLIKDTKDLIGDQHLQQTEKLKQVSLNDFNLFRKWVFNHVVTLENNMQENAEKALELIANENIPSQDFSGGLNGIPSFFKKIMAGKFEFPTATHSKIIQEEKYTSAKANATSEAKIIAIFPTLKKYFYNIETLLQEYLIWNKVRVTVASLSVMNELEKSLQELKNENNILLITDFNKLISKNLKNQPSAFIYEKIGSKYKHYFIDEFQDTSTLQWQNFEPLIENARASSDTVMLVGDAKQSIYRWRGGNPKLMMDLIEHKDNLKINVENLPTNYRSLDNIIHFNNEFYTFIANQLNNKSHKDLYKTGNQQLNNNKQGGYIQIDFFERLQNHTSYKEETYQQILNIIQELINKDFTLGEICILFRSNTEGKAIAEFLFNNNIPVLSSEALLLKTSAEIQLLISFFKAIANEEDESSKAAFIIQLHQLELIKSDDITEFIQTIKKTNNQTFAQLLKSKNITVDFINSPAISIYNLVEQSIKALELGKKDTAYIQNFLDFVLEFSNKNESDLNQLLNTWEIKKDKLSIAMPHKMNAVSLLSIHKSKGLQFPVVILPFADWGTNSNEIWIPIEHESAPFKEFYIKSMKDLEKASPQIATLVEDEKNALQLDDLNVLYVATTRAVEQLYIITKIVDKKSKSNTITVANYLNDFVAKNNLPNKGNVPILGEKKRKEKPKLKVQPIETINYISNTWSNRLSISQEHKMAWKQNNAIVYGELIHDIMQNIYTGDDVGNAIIKAKIKGIIQQNEVATIQSKINEIINHPTLNKYFKPHLKIINERDFITANGIIIRPDRLIITNKNCTIIDYKTGKNLPKHEEQINQYATHLTQMDYNIDEKILVYINDEITVKIVD